MSKHNPLNLDALKEFVCFLHGSWEEEVVLIKLLRILKDILGCSRASAYLLDDGEFKLKAKIGGPDLLNSPQAIRQCQALAANFNLDDDIGVPVLLNGDLYIIPLKSPGELYGVVLYEVPTPSQALNDMVSIIATQASAALKNNWLADEKKMINEIISTFNSGPDLQVYYPRFAQKLKQIAPFDRLTITIPEPFYADSLIVYAEDSKNPFSVTRVPYENSAPSWVISTGQPIVENDLSENRNFLEDELLLNSGIRCALRVPLMSRGQVIGSLNIGSETPNAYSQREITLFIEVADRIGPAVENALVYEAINEKLGRALGQLDETFSAVLNALTVLLDKRDTGTKGHSLRVVRYAVAIAENLGVEGRELDDIRLGSLLHDIGKIGIPDSILFKPDKLTDEEWVIMKTHPKLGADIISKLGIISPALPIVLHHHEWFDGHGYPDGLAGGEIPLGARIFTIADAFDAMTSSRPYKKAISIDEAVAELARARGSQFCPVCIDAFMRISLKELTGIYEECQSEVDFKSSGVTE